MLIYFTRRIRFNEPCVTLEVLGLIIIGLAFDMYGMEVAFSLFNEPWA